MLTPDYDKLLKTARWLVQDDAEDAVQDTLAHFYDAGKFNAGKFDAGKAALTTYLTKKLRWYCLNLLHARKLLDYYEAPLEDAETRLEDSKDPVTRLHVRLDVDAALRHLPMMTRRVVISRLIDGKTMRVTAQELQLSSRSADRHLQAGRQELRRRLAAYSDGVGRCRLRKQK